MVSPKETTELIEAEQTGRSTKSFFSGADMQAPEWYMRVYNSGLIYAVSIVGDQTLRIIPIVPDESYQPTPYEITDHLLEAWTGNLALIEKLQHWQRKSQREALQRFIPREAEKLGCILVVQADYREDAIDLLFVVEGDLYDGESAVLPILSRLYDNFPDIPLDFMVLPAARYNPEFRWGVSSEVLFTRKGQHR